MRPSPPGSSPGPAQVLTFTGRDAWRAWLEQHHATAREAWVAIHKKNAKHRGLSYEEAVEEALCFGWIDGLSRSIDEETFGLRFTARKPRSVWSESNKRRVEKLIHEGRMTPAGLAKVAEAKANGEWDAAAERENVETGRILRRARGVAAHLRRRSVVDR